MVISNAIQWAGMNGAPLFWMIFKRSPANRTRNVPRNAIMLVRGGSAKVVRIMYS